MNRLLRPAFAALAAACLCASSRAEAEPIELFYYVNRTLFHVESFEDGLPKLDREADPGGPYTVESPADLVPIFQALTAHYHAEDIANAPQPFPETA